VQRAQPVQRSGSILTVMKHSFKEYFLGFVFRFPDKVLNFPIFIKGEPAIFGEKKEKGVDKVRKIAIFAYRALKPLGVYKMIALVIGILLLAFGVWAILPFDILYGRGWGLEVLAFLKGGAPILAFLIGLIALFIGIADIKDKIDAKKEEKASDNSPEEKK